MQYLDKNGLTHYTTEMLKKTQEVYVGDTEPTNDNVKVWIDPSGDVTPIPTKTSDLVNDSDFTTETYVNNLVGNINTVLATLTEVTE